MRIKQQFECVVVLAVDYRVERLVGVALDSLNRAKAWINRISERPYHDKGLDRQLGLDRGPLLVSPSKPSNAASDLGYLPLRTLLLGSIRYRKAATYGVSVQPHHLRQVSLEDKPE